MNILIPVELLPAILVLLIALGQLLRPFHFRNIIFSIILIEMGYLHFLHMYIMYTKSFISGSGLFLTAQPVFLSIGVFIYIYIRSIKNEVTSFSQVDLKHFIPTLVSMVILVALMAMRRDAYNEALNSGAGKAAVMVYFSFAWITLAGYVGRSIIIVRKSLVQGNPVHRVFRLFLVLMLLVFPAMITGILTVVMALPGDSIVSRLYIIIISVIMISLYLIMQRNPYLVQYGTVPVRKKSRDCNFPAGTDIENIKNLLKIIMEEEKIFCDEDMSLARLSDVLGITPHLLSRLLNEHFGKNFNSFINTYRIEEARNMLIDEPDRSTLSVACAVGFNTYSVFYTSFRKETSLSPAEFRKQNIKH